MPILCALLFMLCTNLFAMSQDFPSNCRSIVVNDSSLALSPDKEMLVLLHNSSTSDVWVIHPVTKKADADWQGRLEHGSFSAFVYKGKSFDLNCIESRPGHEQHLPCADLIRACAINPVKIPAQQPDATFAAENMPLKALLAFLGGQGFELPDSQQ